MELSHLKSGQVLLDEPLFINASDVDAYIRAVRDDTDFLRDSSLIPPMAIAAFVMSKTMQAIDLPPGTVHTGQEIEISLALETETTLHCVATVRQNSLRNSARFINIDIETRLIDIPVLTGQIFLIIEKE